MRTALTLVAVLLIGVAAKLAFFGAAPAEAVISSATIDTRELQQNITNLPVLKFQDRSFVFVED